MIILPELRVVEAHDLLLPTAPGILDFATDQVAVDPQRFTLADLRRRGRYLEALSAPTYDRAAAWMGDQVLPHLPINPDDLPDGLSSEQVWAELASSHGQWGRGVQRRVRMKQVAFERLVATSEQQGVIHRLPRWRDPGEVGSTDSKLYLSDPGILHRLLNWNERMYEYGPFGRSKAAEEIFWEMRARSWEGFVVSSMLRAASHRASATVWEENPGEIDLILNWGRETWAIEVTRGKTKRFREVHGKGHRATGATRPIILVFDDEVGIPELRGSLQLGHRVEAMTLEQALREIRSGP